MVKFEPGDKVLLKDQHGYWSGVMTVKSVRSFGGIICLHSRHGKGGFDSEELVLAEGPW